MSSVYWLIGGLLLIVLELFNPGAYLLWLGLGALCTTLLVWLAPELGTVWQVFAFGVFSLAAILGYRQWRRLHPRIEASDHPLLNQRAARLIGQVHPLDTAIVNGRGRIQVGDAYWQVAGPELPAGQRVRVMATNSVGLLSVEPLP